MKYSITIFIFGVTVLLSSCFGKKSVTLEDTSPNKHVKVTVNANKPAALEPWKVDLKVKSYDFKEGALSFEIYADDLTPETVKFNWSDDKNCIITFRDNEDKKRTFQLLADANQVQLAEI